MKPLTYRELSCLQWVSIGKTSWEISLILELKERTVNFHIQSACRKLRVNNRLAAITIALRAGMLDFDAMAFAALPPVPPRPVARSRRPHRHAAHNIGHAVRPKRRECWPCSRLGNTRRTVG